MNHFETADNCTDTKKYKEKPRGKKRKKTIRKIKEKIPHTGDKASLDRCG